MEKESKGGIGILGGMGPEATLNFYAEIIRNTPAEKDQDHLRVVIEADPRIPDRTAGILGTGESPVPALLSGCRVLELAGADFIVMPCVSAHAFLMELRSGSQLPILSIFDAVAEAVTSHHPPTPIVGLLGTTGTVQSGLFQQRLAADGIRTVVCDAENQARVMAAIYHIKQARPERSREAVAADLCSAAGSLIARGAAAIVAGCTEIPLALRQDLLTVPYFDAVLLLARAAIRRAGREPISL